MFTLSTEHFLYRTSSCSVHVVNITLAVRYNTIQYNTIQYNTIQYNTIQYNTIQYNTILYNTIQYNTIQYNTIQYNTIQYNTIQFFRKCTYNQIVQHSRIRAMGEKCPLRCPFFHHICFVEFIHCRECRANGFAG